MTMRVRNGAIERRHGAFLAVGALLWCAQMNVSFILSDISDMRLKNQELTSQNKELLQGISKLQVALHKLEDDKDNLKLRVDGWMNWNTDPYKGSQSDPSICKESTDLTKYGCKKEDGCDGYFDHVICLDNLKYGDCIVYDFGIRANPEFGLTLLKPPFNCKIYAFDPSPVTRNWWEKKSSEQLDELRSNPNYKLHYFGAGGKDGEVQLNEYNWEQVSIVRFPMALKKDCSNDPNARDCDPLVRSIKGPKPFNLPVRTLGSIMKQFGHDHIDILKLDVEGSEYMFLEEAIESGSLEKVEQFTVEWHHFDFDSRYGGGSAPAINALVALMNKIGLHQFFIKNGHGGWPSLTKDFWERGMTLRYNLGSFMRVDDKQAAVSSS